MKHRLSLCLLLLLMPSLASAQIIMGGPSMKADTERALNELKELDAKRKKNLEILDRLTDKNINIGVNEFYFIYPPEPEKGKPWPLVSYDSSLQGIVELEIVPPGESVRVYGILVGETEAKWHRLPACPHYWCIFKAIKPGLSALSAWRNGDDPTKQPPVQTNKMLVTVTGKIPDPIIPTPDPIKPDPVKPDPVKPDPVDNALVTKFKATLAQDKTEAGNGWDMAVPWMESYNTMAKILQQNDPAMAPQTVSDLFEKHKREWLLKGVPPPPFLKNTRTELSSIISGVVGTTLTDSLDSAKRATISAKYAEVYAALKAAHATIK